MEEWRQVPEYEGFYEVSDAGRVRSVDRTVPGAQGLTYALRGCLLAQHSDGGGYLRVSLFRDGVGRTIKVHRLVLLAFIGPPADGMEGCHNDGDSNNNTLSNLRWGTKAENSQDTLRHGRHPMRSRTHCVHGHEYTPENTRMAGTVRRCRECNRIKCRAWKLRTRVLEAS
jgi:hypothetical protein